MTCGKRYLALLLCLLLLAGCGGNPYRDIPAPQVLGASPVSYTHLDVYKRQPHRALPHPVSLMVKWRPSEWTQCQYLAVM